MWAKTSKIKINPDSPNLSGIFTYIKLKCMVNVGKYSKYSSPIRHIWERKTQTCHSAQNLCLKICLRRVAYIPICCGLIGARIALEVLAHIYICIYKGLTSQWMVNYVATLHGMFSKKTKELPNIHCVMRCCA